MLQACWETSIMTFLKPNGDIRICSDYKFTINNALQQHACQMLVIRHHLTFLTGAKVFGKFNLAQAYQQLPIDNNIVEALTIDTHWATFRVVFYSV